MFTNRGRLLPLKIRELRKWYYQLLHRHTQCIILSARLIINFRLFACYNDGIINLLEKYFDMNKKNCRDALDLYKKFLIRMDRVGEFLKVNTLGSFAVILPLGHCSILRILCLYLYVSICLSITIWLIVTCWSGGWKRGNRQRRYTWFDKGA